MSDDRTYDGTVRLNANHIVAAKTVLRRDILSQIQGPGSPQQLILSGDKTIIGRSPETDIQMRSNMVSTARRTPGYAPGAIIFIASI